MTGRSRSDLGILVSKPEHGSKILRPGKKSRARHTSPPGKGGEAGLKNDRQPVAATTRTRLHLPSRKLRSRKVQNQPRQIESSDLASPVTPKPAFRKNQKNTLFQSDPTDPGAGRESDEIRQRFPEGGETELEAIGLEGGGQGALAGEQGAAELAEHEPEGEGG